MAGLFECEEAVLAAAEAHLAAHPDEAIAPAAYAELVEGYQKLLREMQRLVRSGDRREGMLQELNERLRHEVEERKLMQEQLVLSERLAAVGTLAAGIAHEFNNINAIILGHAELGRLADGLPEEAAGMFESITEGALRGRDIARNLLQFSGSLAIEAAPGSLAELVEETLQLVRHQLETQGVQVEKQFAPAAPVVLDRSHMGQVILNLLTNAWHAMLGCERQVLRLVTECVDGEVRLQVSDSGVGMTSGECAQIFNPFFTRKGEHALGGGAQARVKGVGLGLSISKRIVEEHGGRLAVESRPGQGTTFTLALPLAKDGTVHALPGGAPFTAVYDPLPPDLRILIVEDEPSASRMLEKMLHRLGVRAVQAFADAEAALRHLAGEVFDVAFVDLQMPGMDGFAFLEAVAELPVAQRPLPIVWSGRCSGTAILRARCAGAEHQLSKPFRLRELERVLREALAAQTGDAVTVAEYSHG